MKPISFDVKSKYELYLESSDFALLRQAVFERDGYKCVVCESPDDLRLHHLTYLHVYHEDLRDLITLCDKCHSIYHAIDNRKKLLEELLQDEYQKQREHEYQERQEQFLQEREKEQEKYEKEQRQRKKVEKAIFEEIKTVYGPQDYAKDGDLDMCSWSVLNRVIDKISKDHNVSYYSGNKMDIQKWFFYRRMEFFKRCLEHGLSIKTMSVKTKFPWSYLNNYYRSDVVEAKLKEEETINQLKKDKED